eukprot:14731305-Alexandrium_andersonii.AAC.1
MWTATSQGYTGNNTWLPALPAVSLRIAEALPPLRCSPRRATVHPELPAGGATWGGWRGSSALGGTAG